LKYFIGLDGGGSKTRAVLVDCFTSRTIEEITIDRGSNLSDSPEAVHVLYELVVEIIEKSSVSNDSIIGIGIGVASSSNKKRREEAFQKFKSIGLSGKVIILNDAEAAYEVCCLSKKQILVTIGTGIICLARGDGNKSVVTAGKGHHNGDIGSGYWIGNKLLISIAMRDNDVPYEDFQACRELVCDFFSSSNIDNIIIDLGSDKDKVKKVASIAKGVIGLAKDGNQLALNILQEATFNVSEYIIQLADILRLSKERIVLAGNGSIISSNFYRKLLNECLEFNFSEVIWTFSSIPASYGACIVSARVNNKHLPLDKLIKGKDA
tara:strand:- start:38 stop:1003 length:966 start_codon:yes stop_codon:yes gene_type:complete